MQWIDEHFTNFVLYADIEENVEYDEEDQARISKLFYLQLYSDVLNAEKNAKSGNYKKKLRGLYTRRKKSKVQL